MSINTRQKLLNTFYIKHNSEVDDRRYEGEFTTKKLTIRDLATVGVRKVQLNGGFHFSADKPGYGVDESTDELNSMMAHLDLALVKAPTWWNLDEITDMELLGKVYKEVLVFENSFLGRNKSREAGSEDLGGSSEGASSSETTEANPAGSPREVVDKEVQAALEP